MSTTATTLAVTGATGVLGRLVAQRLAEQGQRQRLLVRTVSRAPELPGTTVHPFSYDDRSASITALTGVSTLFMVSAAENERRIDQHRAFVDAAAAAGVEHIVYTSFVSAAPDSTFTLARDHYATEQLIKQSGMAWTLLRDSLYLDFLSELVGEDGVIRGPAGAGRVAAVARADVAAVAATVLLAPAAHENVTYDLTGPQALSMLDVAAIVSEQRGRTVSYHDETLAEAYASRARWAAPDWQNDAWVSTYTSIAAGELAQVTEDVRTVLGRPPIGLARFLAEHS